MSERHLRYGRWAGRRRVTGCAGGLIGRPGSGTDATVSRHTSRTVTHSTSQASPVNQPAMTSVAQCTPR